jgi:diaminobutyrate-2-oxoglutarate transaminase
MGHGALALTGNLGAKNAINGLMPGVQFFPYPYIYRCPFGIGGEGSIDAACHYFERTLKDPESGIRPPAAVILEAVQGEGGVIPAPAKWLQTVRRVTEELGIPLILDEIQAGVGRTGTFFAFEHAGIVPDVILISKAIGGSLPLSVVIYHEKLDLWQPGAHAGTFRGNQMAMAAGIKVMEIIDRDNLLQKVKENGLIMRKRLNELKESVSIIGDVRGMGFMKGVEFIDPRQPEDHMGTGVGSGEIAGLVQKLCFDNNVILEKGGRYGAVMRFMPALNISDEDLDLLLTTFEKVTREVNERYA